MYVDNCDFLYAKGLIIVSHFKTVYHCNYIIQSLLFLYYTEFITRIISVFADHATLITIRDRESPEIESY